MNITITRVNKVKDDKYKLISKLNEEITDLYDELRYCRENDVEIGVTDNKLKFKLELLDNIIKH